MNASMLKSQAPIDGQAEESRLRELIQTRSFAFGDFTLSSGKKSNVYFNLKPTMMTAEGAYLCARAFLPRCREAAYIGGLEMGAVPIIASVAALAHIEGVPIATFFVRKKAKEHGAKLIVEGLSREESLHGKEVIVADDVTTSGQSVLKAVEAARDAGGVVRRAISLVDRREGAEALLAQHGIQLESVFSVSDFT